MVGIFQGRKLSRIGGIIGFRGETFHGCLARTAYILSSEHSNNLGENFRYKTKIFSKVFSLESFLPRKFPTIRDMTAVSGCMSIKCSKEKRACNLLLNLNRC